MTLQPPHLQPALWRLLLLCFASPGEVYGIPLSGGARFIRRQQDDEQASLPAQQHQRHRHRHRSPSTLEASGLHGNRPRRSRKVLRSHTAGPNSVSLGRRVVTEEETMHNPQGVHHGSEPWFGKPWPYLFDDPKTRATEITRLLKDVVEAGEEVKHNNAKEVAQDAEGPIVQEVVKDAEKEVENNIRQDKVKLQGEIEEIKQEQQELKQEQQEGKDVDDKIKAASAKLETASAKLDAVEENDRAKERAEIPHKMKARTKEEVADVEKAIEHVINQVVQVVVEKEESAKMEKISRKNVARTIPDWGESFGFEAPRNESVISAFPVDKVQCTTSFCGQMKLHYLERNVNMDVQGFGYWTNWFNEYPPAEGRCNLGSAVVQIECSGLFCRKLRMYCQRPNIREWQVDDDVIEEHGWFNEESHAQSSCTNGFTLYGIRCSGLYCRDKKILCKMTKPAAVDCKWGPWTAWGECLGYCGNSYRSRKRTIFYESVWGGFCHGPEQEQQACALHSCQIESSNVGGNP